MSDVMSVQMNSPLSGRATRAAWASMVGLALAAMSCGEGAFEVDGEGVEGTQDSVEALAMTGVNADGRTVSTMITQACSTVSVKGLSQQLIEEINCLSPDTMAPIPTHRNLQMTAAVFPFMQKGAAEALKRALDARSGTMVVTSALRTLPQQYLLYQWYRNGRRCGIRLAAPPGTSNHEGGLAIDTTGYVSWRSALGAQRYRWFGAGDEVHFDYTGPSKNIQSLSVRAFQRLWNRNNPQDRIAEDGAWGPSTEARLRRSPAVGFAKGATCGPTMEPVVEVSAIEVYWFRNGDGSYNLRALAPSHVERVQYVVDGFVIGSATRQQGSNFPAQYTFSSPRRERRFEVRGLDASGAQVGLGVGLIDVTPEFGVYIRQLGRGMYSVGLERAPEGVAYIEVAIDGFEVGSSAGSDRQEVSTTLSQLGPREVELRTYNADGSQRGTLRRTFTF